MVPQKSQRMLYARGGRAVVRLKAYGQEPARVCARICGLPMGLLGRAELTQLVECQLPKLDVAGSTPVLRSIFPPA